MAQHKQLRVRPTTSSRITKLPQHEADGCEFQERKRVAVEVFPVLGEAAATVVRAVRVDIDSLDEQLHDPRLFGRE